MRPHPPRQPTLPSTHTTPQYLRPYGWRVSLACGAIPALLLSIGALVLPDTPNSLVLRGQKEEGRKVLQRIRGTEHVDVEFEVGPAACSGSPLVCRRSP